MECLRKHGFITRLSEPVVTILERDLLLNRLQGIVSIINPDIKICPVVDIRIVLAGVSRTCVNMKIIETSLVMESLLTGQLNRMFQRAVLHASAMYTD